MPNLKAEINEPKKKILENTLPLQTKTRNYLKKENCPMKAACFPEKLLHYVKN